MGASSNLAVCRVGLGCFGFRRVTSVALAALLLGLALLVGAASSASAQESASLTFEVGQPLSLTWGQLVHGKTIQVCNGGRATVARVHAIPTDFAFTRSGVGVAPSKVVAVEPSRRAVRAGECAPLHVLAASEVAPDTGEYAGSLLLVGAGGGSARLATTIVAEPDKAAAPAGVAEPDSLSIASATPWSRGGDAVLLLKQPAAGEVELSVGERCERAAPNMRDCPFIGNLYRGGQIVRVRVIGPSRLNGAEGVQELPVRLHSSAHPVGDFEGALTLPGATQSIKVKLTAKDAWWCAVVALLLGAVFALLVQLWNGRWRPRGALIERKRALTLRYRTSSVPGYPEIELSAAGLTTYLAGINEAIEQYAASVVEFDTTSDAYKAIDASLKLAEDDAAILSGEGGLKRSLDPLKGELQTTIEMLSDKEVADTPEILGVAAEILNGGTLAVGEAIKRKAQAEALLPVLIQWRKLVSRLMTNAVWLKALTANGRLIESGGPDSAMLARAGVELWALRKRLFEVASASDLAAIGSSGAPAQAFARVAYLGVKYEIVEPDPNQAPKAVDGKLQLTDLGYVGSKTGAPTLTMKRVYANAASVDVQAAEPARLPAPQKLRVVGDSIALLASVAISVVAGLSTFYFSKSFGSFDDYLTVIVIGSAAQTIVKAVLNQTSLLLHDFAPAAPLMPARIVVPPAALAPATGAAH
jgi:hypothetical protein